MKILELGSGGKRIFADSFTLDKERCFTFGCGVVKRKTDVVHNLEKKKLPFKSKTFDRVYAYHVLEHINNFDNLMKEIHRVLKNHGVLYVKVPYGQSYLAKHPYHVNQFSLNSFEEGWNLEYQKLFKSIRKEFKMGITKHTGFLNAINPLINSSPRFQQFCELVLFNFIIPPQELYFELRKRG